MRLFAAMLLPPEIVGHLDEHIDAVRSARPDLRWMPAGQWHLTLQFLGECGPYEVDRQLDRWSKRAGRCRPMQLNLQSAGAFPKVFSGRVLWTGLGGDLDDWRRVAAPDQEPHVTLARTRERVDLTGVVDELAGYTGPPWTVDQIALMESRVNAAAGPRYQPIEYLPLGELG